MQEKNSYLNPCSYINIYMKLWYSKDSMLLSRRKPVCIMDNNELEWRLNLAMQHNTRFTGSRDSDRLIEMLTWWKNLAQETKELIRLMESLRPQEKQIWPD